MQIKTYLYMDKKWNEPLDTSMDSSNTLVIVFGSTDILSIQEGLDTLIAFYKNATIMGCSTSGEIYKSEVYDTSLSVAIVQFDKSTFRLVIEELEEENSFEIGKKILDRLRGDDLKSIFLLCDAQNVDGSQLSRGLNENLPPECAITGGLAGDGVAFNKTWIILNGMIVKKHISAVGLYGKDLRVHYGCKCGWSRFGVERRVTSIKGNTLYTLDNKPALELYKTYLGIYASELPAAALHFPLMVLKDGGSDAKIRAIRAIDEENNSIILAGSIQQDSIVSFAKANFDELIDGAQEAAELVSVGYDKELSALCIAVSCIARRNVLKQNAEDELEVVVDTLGANVATLGFYSFGEFSKSQAGCCDFHNQSISLTMIYEL
ncbi:MAG: FIST N-terminal domain-containing protein [Sulfurimonas sp.]|nr:FIST N-terminal domain-containing protein [Sulfurimonas sp.]MDD3060690.1 FIST N-terminal domain-containing protein [Sulfurimonas sp.]